MRFIACNTYTNKLLMRFGPFEDGKYFDAESGKNEYWRNGDTGKAIYQFRVKLIRVFILSAGHYKHANSDYYCADGHPAVIVFFKQRQFCFLSTNATY